MANDINRVFLWGISRSLSTAVVRCLSYVDGIQIINQPYASAHFNGPEEATIRNPSPNDKAVCQFMDVYRKTKDIMARFRGLDNSLLSYKWIRDDLLEGPFPGKKIVLCRDQAAYLQGKHEMLPKTYKYSFLLRHPTKVLLSNKKFKMQAYGDIPDMRALPDKIFPKGCGYKELYDLYEYVRANIDPEPTVMDTDDLLENPARVMSVYCRRMGIPFDEKLLSWPARDDIANTWIQAKTLDAANVYMHYYTRASESVQFGKPTPIPKLDSLPEDVQECVKYSMGYYEIMRRQRIT